MTPIRFPRPALALVLALASCASPGAPAENPWPCLRAERDRAAWAGLRWLDAYLADEEHAAALGVDAVAIFADYAATASDEVAREFSLDLARRHARNLEEGYLAREFLTTTELVDLILLLTQVRELGLDMTGLRERAVRGFEELPHPDLVYGLRSLAPEDLDRLREDRFFELLLAVYSVERAVACGEDFGIRFGLKELLPVLRRRVLIERSEDPGPSKELYRDHIYRATHIAYLFTDYGRLRQRQEDAPEVIDYLRRVFPDVLAARDVELVAEIVDVWRSLGYDETDSALVRDGTLFLLAAQQEDASWGLGPILDDSYLDVHPTWCAIMALGERRCRSNTPFERHLREILRSEVAE